MPKEILPSPPASTDDTPMESEEAGVAFADTRRFSLVGAAVDLAPAGLVAKRQFSKKYPIAITMQEDEEEIVGERKMMARRKRKEDGEEGKKNETENECFFEGSSKLRRRPVNKKVKDLSFTLVCLFFVVGVRVFRCCCPCFSLLCLFLRNLFCTDRSFG